MHTKRAGRIVTVFLMAGAAGVYAGSHTEFLGSPAAAANRMHGIDPRGEIETFNQNYIEAHRRMDNAAILATWADDGVSLLPSTEPIEGKPAITKFLNEVTGSLAGYKMEKVEMDFRGIEVNDDWASEWANEHQRVQPPDGKPVIDSFGKMLLVLHRESDGKWRVKREMWNQGLKP